VGVSVREPAVKRGHYEILSTGTGSLVGRTPKAKYRPKDAKDNLFNNENYNTQHKTSSHPSLSTNNLTTLFPLHPA
jgi:hypothetical protein